MPCTTILVGKKASNDGSTMIARTDDGGFDVKKVIVVTPDKQPKEYKTVISHLTIKLPDNPVRYTSAPNVDKSEGVWPAAGINEKNVSMTATETITTNPRVLGGDPFVTYKKAKNRNEKDVPGGIGEEDLVLLVLPYINSAREGVVRLGKLLEEYGTYESNGIGFSDKDEIWWFETIGGHHWMARRVKDEEVVIMPNQLGIDYFDFNDAYGEQKEFMCSSDLKEFVEKYHLNLNQDDTFNPRACFGSRLDSDHIYNTPRGWFMGRYFCPTSYIWDGPDAEFTPESDDIPWSFIPERKVTPEDIKYVLSSHMQGTPYDPYLNSQSGVKGKYRTIGVANTGVMTINQIRGYLPYEIQAVEWVCFGSTSFDTVVPIYTNVNKLPDYLSKVEVDVDSNNFYWASRLIDVLTDAHYNDCIRIVSAYQNKVPALAYAILNEYDAKMSESNDFSLIPEANKKLCDMAKEETQKTLNTIVRKTSELMKNRHNMANH